MSASSPRSSGTGVVDDEPDIVTDPSLPPVSLSDEQDAKANRRTWPKIVLWAAIAHERRYRALRDHA